VSFIEFSGGTFKEYATVGVGFAIGDFPINPPIIKICRSLDCATKPVTQTLNLLIQTASTARKAVTLTMRVWPSARMSFALAYA
jgi:hypothetical protein